MSTLFYDLGGPSKFLKFVPSFYSFSSMVIGTECLGGLNVSLEKCSFYSCFDLSLFSFIFKSAAFLLVLYLAR